MNPADYRKPFYCAELLRLVRIGTQYGREHIKQCEHCAGNILLYRINEGRLPNWIHKE